MHGEIVTTFSRRDQIPLDIESPRDYSAHLRLTTESGDMYSLPQPPIESPNASGPSLTAVAFAPAALCMELGSGQIRQRPSNDWLGAGVPLRHGARSVEHSDRKRTQPGHSGGVMT
jgi:hypothetical protein